MIGVGHGIGHLEFTFPDPGKTAVAGEGVEPEVDRAVGRAIGVALLHQHLDHVDLLTDETRGGRLSVRFEEAQGGAVLVEDRGPVTRDVGERTSFLPALADRAVVDVGEVANVAHFAGAEFQFKQPA